MTRHIHPRSTSRDIAQHVREAEGQHDWSSGPWRYPPQPEPRRHMGEPTMTSLIEKNCLACGDLIHVRFADHKRGWGKFCDKACAAAHKCGQRPGDVNEYHAECQAGFGWAADKLKDFADKYGEGGKPPKAKPLRDQLGKKARKVKPTYHSPARCRECGEAINGSGLCDACEADRDSLNSMEDRWDDDMKAKQLFHQVMRERRQFTRGSPEWAWRTRAARKLAWLALGVPTTQWTE